MASCATGTQNESDPDTSLSILIVDDEQMVRELLVSCLEDSYSCYTANNAVDALSCLKSRTFDLVVTDITMPGLSGLDFCRMLRDRYPSTAVLVISGLHADQYREEALASGALGLIQKPFDLTSLMNTVDQALKVRTQPPSKTA